MSENYSADSKKSPDNRVDLFAFWRRFRPFLVRFWYLPLLLALVGALFMALRARRSFVPRYRSEAIFSVAVTDTDSLDVSTYSYYYDSAAAKQATATFPYILSSDIMQELLKDRLNVPYLNGSVQAKSIADTNFIELSVTSTNPDDAYSILQAVMEVYPQVSRKVVGETRFTVTQPAHKSTTPYNSLSWKRPAVLGAFAGFVLGVGILLIMTLLRRTILSEDDVKRTSNLNCLGRITNDTEKKRTETDGEAGILVTRLHTDSAFSESLRGFRLKITRDLGPKEKIIMFTSSLPSEGKSSLAANTALLLAGHGKKVLVVDADLRGPSIKSILGITEPSAGLGEWLSGKSEGLNFLRYKETSLYVMGSGEAIPDPTPILVHANINNLFQLLRTMFDYVVVDTPPCTLMSDAAAFCPLVDRVVYVIREDYASVSQVSDGIENLSEHGAKLAGFVLNRCGIGEASSYYYGKYGYGKYGYGKYGYGKYGYSKYSYGKYGYGRYSYGKYGYAGYGYGYGTSEADEAEENNEKQEEAPDSES